MSNNPECPSTCLIKDDPSLCSFAYRVQKVYISDAFESSPHQNMVVAEEAIRKGEIAADDIDRLTSEITDDIDLSLTSCFGILHEEARKDKETLDALTEEQRIAVATCATNGLQRICKR